MHARGIGSAAGLVLKTRITVIVFFFLLSYGVWRVTGDYSLRNYLAAVPALLGIQIFLNDFLMLYLAYEVEVGRRWFSLLIAPGTILHELSHLFSAVLTGCYITEVSLFRYNPQSGLLGYVAFTQPKDKWIVVRNLLVSFAPFFGCGLVLLALSYFMIGGEFLNLDVIQVESYDSLYSSLLRIISDYLEGILLYVLPNPLLWIVFYLQFCFALGSASSTEDLKVFFGSLSRHPISTLFLLLLAYGMLQASESDVSLMDVSPQSVAVSILSAVLSILLYSITVLSCSIPFVYIGDKFLEITFPERIIVFTISAMAYLTASRLFEVPAEQSIAIALSAFLLLLFPFKNKRLFYKG